MNPCLVGHDLGFAYGERFVLRQARAVVAPGRVTALLGPSGSGKTTLLWLMAGLQTPRTGRVVVCDAPAAWQTGRPVGPGDRIGMVFQTPALWDHLTAEEHLEIVLSGKGLDRAARQRRIDALLERMHLGALRKRLPGRMSGGERQRLSIARALVTEPGWLLMDEPLAHLDGPARSDLLDVLRDVLADTRPGVLLATHDTDEALRLANDVVVLLDGAVAQAGTADEVMLRPADLAVARLLGPAAEIAGSAGGGVLRCDGTAVLEGLPAAATGPRRLILRPADLAFRPDASGPARVLRCERTPSGYQLVVEVAGARAWVQHGGPCAAGTVGRLVLVGSMP